MTTSSNPDQTNLFYCSQRSAAVGEPLFGTATHASAWLMIEYPEVWGGQALNESKIPSEVKEYLSSWSQANSKARIQLIRSSVPNTRSIISVFLAVLDQDQPILYRWSLDHYQELLNINFDLHSGSELATESRYKNPLFLVCTNGRRDRCCSKFGLPVSEALSALRPGDTWETTHLGGHRFAANLLCFPHGLFYGHVSPSDADEIVRKYLSGSIVLEKLRGRVNIPEPAQAAEFYLREKIDERRIEALSLLNLDQPVDLHWRAVFLDQDNGQTYLITLHQNPSGLETRMNCSDEKSQFVSLYHLEGIDTLSRL